MRRPRPGGDKQHLWPGTQILYSVHTAQEPNDRFPQERLFEGLINRKSDFLQSANSGNRKPRRGGVSRLNRISVFQLGACLNQGFDLRTSATDAFDEHQSGTV
jgi:hypothetical protein